MIQKKRKLKTRNEEVFPEVDAAGGAAGVGAAPGGELGEEGVVGPREGVSARATP